MALLRDIFSGANTYDVSHVTNMQFVYGRGITKAHNKPKYDMNESISPHCTLCVNIAVKISTLLKHFCI